MYGQARYGVGKEMKNFVKKIIKKIFSVGMGEKQDLSDLKQDLWNLKQMLQAQQAYLSHLIMRQSHATDHMLLSMGNPDHYPLLSHAQALVSDLRLSPLFDVHESFRYLLLKATLVDSYYKFTIEDVLKIPLVRFLIANKDKIQKNLASLSHDPMSLSHYMKVFDRALLGCLFYGKDKVRNWDEWFLRIESMPFSRYDFLNHVSYDQNNNFISTVALTPLNVTYPEGLHGYLLCFGLSATDVVIDAGAFDGATSEFFESHLSDQGHVYAFEAVPQHIDMIEKRQLKKTSVVPMALWHEDTELQFDGFMGPASCMSDSGQLLVKAISLDSFMAQEKLNCVNFIKMDIEGAEPRALSGAHQTILTHVPKMAICIYHSNDDMVNILFDMKEKYGHLYNYYVRCLVMGHRVETVLYCVPK
jgi:FkbM family methyltransferase